MTLHRNRCFVVVDPPTEEDLELTMKVIDAYDFPWVWTLRDNVRSTGKPDLPIGYDDRSGSLGYYTPTFNSLHVDPIADHQGGAARFPLTLAHELTHYVDDTILTGELKVEIHRLMHDGSPMTYQQCIDRVNEGRARPTPESAIWGIGDDHDDRANEAFANMMPRVWAPEHAKTITSYGPHRFTHADRVADLVLAEAPNNPPFSDVEGHAFEKDILWAAGMGIAFGSRGRFNPDEIVTRGQMAAFIRRAISGMTKEFSVPDTDAPELNDIAGHTFEADILWVARKRITLGDTEGNFRPNDPVTRGQMAAFLHRALEPETA